MVSLLVFNFGKLGNEMGKVSNASFFFVYASGVLISGNEELKGLFGVFNLEKRNDKQLGERGKEKRKGKEKTKGEGERENESGRLKLRGKVKMKGKGENEKEHFKDLSFWAPRMDKIQIFRRFGLEQTEINKTFEGSSTLGSLDELNSTFRRFDCSLELWNSTFRRFFDLDKRNSAFRRFDGPWTYGI
ncbi:hypothetical protein RhiirA4_457806 [Rhizophagus irregularis]|uniref:Uncharacterized protein n=1 Tax=Rhizophagus irregularis TaxID=588596 RepID=A0A2I1GAT4_9GLOM|nr:hypothetical protein RhiirA4_457806 [Rhizophagus irregularis]